MSYGFLYFKITEEYNYTAKQLGFRSIDKYFLGSLVTLCCNFIKLLIKNYLQLRNPYQFMKYIKPATCIVILLFSIISSSFQPVTQKNYNISKAERISFKVKGTGHKRIFVTLGVGYQPGSGACCTGVGENSTVSLSGEIGHVVYDGKTRRVITKIYKELEGTTINLADYY